MNVFTSNLTWRFHFQQQTKWNHYLWPFLSSQTGKRGHSSVEDARATMALYKVVEEQWETEMASKSKPESPGLKVTVCR